MLTRDDIKFSKLKNYSLVKSFLNLYIYYFGIKTSLICIYAYYVAANSGGSTSAPTTSIDLTYTKG